MNMQIELVNLIMRIQKKNKDVNYLSQKEKKIGKKSRDRQMNRQQKQQTSHIFLYYYL